MKRYNQDEIALLIEAYKNYASRINSSSSEDNIASFLSSTKSIQMSESRRLIGLAAALTHKIAWCHVCEIYKRCLLCEGQREGIYINWLESATQILDKLGQNSSRENGVEIIEESLQILSDAIRHNPRHNGFAFMTGYFNYRYASYCDHAPGQYEKALSWFRQAQQWQQEDYGEVDNRIKFYIGRCHLALKDWRNALTYYESVDENILASEEGEELLSDLRNGILLAKSAIAGNAD